MDDYEKTDDFNDDDDFDEVGEFSDYDEFNGTGTYTDLDGFDREEYERHLRRRRAARFRPVALPGKFPVSRLVKTLVITFVLLGIVIFLFIQFGWPLILRIPAVARLRQGTSVVDFHTHFSLDPELPQLILDGVRLTDPRRADTEPPPLVEYRGGIPRIYLRASFLRNHIDPFVFWDEGAGVLFVSTLYEMLEFTPGSDHFLLNGSPRPLDTPIREIDGDIFLPLAIVHGLYPIIVEYHAPYNMVVITTAVLPQTIATVTSNRANIRYWQSRTSPITIRLNAGDELVLFLGETDDVCEETYEADSDYIRVRTPEGLLGFVNTSDIGNLETRTPEENFRRSVFLDELIDNKTHPPRVFQGEHGINMLWDYVHNLDANRALTLSPLNPSVNVISPTWFRIADDGTHLTSFASREYVDWAHAQGVAVWPKVFDVNPTLSRRFLTSRTARQVAVNQLIEFVDTFNLDGLNIDFEHLRNPEEGAYKIQFLRELSIPMRQRGVVLSAAVLVPRPYTAFYRRDLLAKTVDFIMVMAYDEHWETAPTAGPNASLPFVRRAVEDMLADGPVEGPVPAERIVLGLPFYNRIWRETMGTGEVSHYRAWNTPATRAFFEERGVTWVWDFELGLYRGEVSAFYEGETVIFRVWLECARSIQQKLHIFYDNNLAGVAAWMRLFETDEFWHVIGGYF